MELVLLGLAFATVFIALMEFADFPDQRIPSRVLDRDTQQHLERIRACRRWDD